MAKANQVSRIWPISVESIRASGDGPVKKKNTAATTASTEVWYPLPYRNQDHSPLRMCIAWRPTMAAAEFVPGALISGGRRNRIEATKTKIQGAEGRSLSQRPRGDGEVGGGCTGIRQHLSTPNLPRREEPLPPP